MILWTKITRDLGLLTLRVGFSAVMLTHGFGKFKKLISKDFNFADPIGIGEAPSLSLTVFAEFICPILIIIGFKTRLAAIPVAFTMLIAAFVIHADDPFSTKELAFLYMIAFIAIALLGPGKYSIDRN